MKLWKHVFRLNYILSKRKKFYYYWNHKYIVIVKECKTSSIYLLIICVSQNTSYTPFNTLKTYLKVTHFYDDYFYYFLVKYLLTILWVLKFFVNDSKFLILWNLQILENVKTDVLLKVWFLIEMMKFLQ